jgi:hypothetical protein
MMPVRRVGSKWYWGSRGPFDSEEEARGVERAAYASGYKGGGKRKRRGWDGLSKQQKRRAIREAVKG